jgi:sugar-specific transcriptional regulator TrmB
MTEEINMSAKEQAEKILVGLGLNHSQAKLYVSVVFFFNRASVNAISQRTSMARQEIYRLLGELHELGLVEKEIANPIMFKAISIKEAISILMVQRKKKLYSLTSESNLLFARLPKKLQIEQNQSSQEFIMVPRGKALVERIKRAIEASNHKVVAITPRKILSQWIFMSPQLWQKILEKGVEVEWIVETESRPYLKSENKILCHPRFKVRILSQCMSVKNECV